MAALVVLPEEDIPHIFEGEIVILVSQEALDASGITLDEAQAAAEDYTCGDEADYWVDLVLAPNHYFFQQCEQRREEKQQGERT